MDYVVGDKVVYPHRGAGSVTAVENLELVDGFERYYVIDIPGEGLTVHIPVDKTDDLGVRPIVTERRLDRVMGVLSKEPQELPDDYKERQAGVRDKLGTGLALEIAETVRDLLWHEQRAHLTKVDRRLLDAARELLAGEIALATGDEVTEAQDAIDAAVAEALDKPE